MSILQNFNYNDKVIQRREDGFVNLTQMCQANGKLVADFLRLKTTKAYIAELSASMGIPIDEIVESKEGAMYGTWGHPMVALRLAQWISPKFAVWCDAHIFNLMTTGKTELSEDPIDKLIKLEELRYKNSKIACDMATMHGKEYGALALGRPDAVVEVDRPVLEVIDNRCGDRRRGMTMKQLNEYLVQKTGQGFKSGSDLRRYLESNAPELVDLIQRPINQDFVNEQNIDRAIAVLMQRPKQLRIGE